MSGKVLIGAAAAIAGGAYLYDRNVHPIFPQLDVNQVQRDANDLGNSTANLMQDAKRELGHQVNHAQGNLQSAGQYTADAARNAANQVSAAAEEAADYSRAKMSELTSQLKLSDTFKWIDSKLEPYKDDTERYRYAVKDLLTDEYDKPYLTQIVHKYIAAVNKLGGHVEVDRPFSVSEDMQRKAWLATLNSDKSEAQQRATSAKLKGEDTVNLWLNWGLNKADEAKSEYYKQKSRLGDKFDQAKDTAAYNYEQAKKNLDDVIRRADSGKLDAAKKNFNDALGHLKSYGDDVVNEVNHKL